MKHTADTHNPTHRVAWLQYSIIGVIIEKIIQHIVVTIAFIFNWAAIRSTVVVDPTILMILGAIIAGLFLLSLWGIITQRLWAIDLCIGLALCDIIGEFVAQGTLDIKIPVSFLMAILLLALATAYRRQKR